MLIIFFAIVFIAELIITFELIRLIVKCDNAVIKINNQVYDSIPKIKKELTAVRIAVNKVLLEVIKFQIKLQQQKEKYTYNILKSIITLAIFVILHKNGKQALAFVDLIFAIKNFLNGFELAIKKY